MMLRYLIYAIIFFSPLTVLAQGPNTPLEFIKNEGQWDHPFIYKSSAGNVNLFLQKTGIVYVIGAPDNAEKVRDFKHNISTTPPTLSYHRYTVNFLGANQNAEIIGSKEQSHYYNYFFGNDSSKWKTNIHPNLSVDYKDIYKNIDLHIASAQTSIKYDFIVQQGGDPSIIKLNIDGAEDIRIKSGKLLIKTSVGDVTEMKPYAYQYNADGVQEEVTCKYKLDGNTVTYYLPKGYDKTRPLIIDPTVVFSTYTGSTADNWGFTATYDAQGNFYAGGAVDAFLGGAYLTTNGAFQTTYQGGSTGGGNDTAFRCDMAITKFNAAGSAMIYSTYIGGNNNDQPHSMIVDASGNLIVAGRTYSNNFPMAGSPYDNTYNQNADIVVVKLNSTGSALIGSTYVGGSGDDGVNISSLYSVVNSSLKHSYGDEARSEVIIDAQNNIYVAASTRSGNFPTVNPIQNSLQGSQDGVVFKLNSNLSSLLWSTYLGGSGDDAAYVLTLNLSESHLYVSGGTTSNNFPFTTGTLWSSYQGGLADGYIAKFQNSGTYPLVRATSIGRSSYDQCYGVQIDDENNVYTMGQTLGGSFPVSSGVFSVPNSSQFVMKLDSNLSSTIYSTVFGSGTSSTVNITPVAFLVDTCQNVYISGWGGPILGNGGSTVGMPIPTNNPATTPNNILKFSSSGGNDFYFMALSKNAATLLYGAYYGLTNNNEHVDGGTSRFDKNGVIYQAICGGCGGLDTEPTTNGAFSNLNGSSNCNLIALKIAFNLSSVEASFNISPTTTVCLGTPISFLNTSSNALTYEWDFGDGSPINTQNSPTHTYATGGTFQVKLIARNPNVCKTEDSAFITVTIDTNSIDADFDVVILDSCGPYTAAITNKSKFGNTPNTATFTWDLGDGSTFTGTTPPTHTYATKGTYTIKLVMNDPNACNGPDSITKTITFTGSIVEADWEFPSPKCAEDTALFNNKSQNATSYLWVFGDGDSSTATSPVHSYDTSGTYTVKFYAFNPNTCNKVDSMESTITISENPIANFVHAPVIPETNEPITFTNRSVGADLYNWNFGDGTGSQEKDPPPHLYKKTGSYTVCLTATNKQGCLDIICKTIQADVYPLADIPNAFSPNKDGANDVLYVRGSGIEEMILKIYNRWGEVIFETTDQNIGWDGTYKGKEQPMESYGFVLDVTFIDGTTFHKSGNITLLR